MNFKDLSPEDIVGWCRWQSKQFTEIANTIEATFKRVSNGKKADTGTLPLPKVGDVTLAQLRERIRHKTGRIRNLATYFNVDESTIENLINRPDSGIMVAERGWLKLQDGL